MSDLQIMQKRQKVLADFGDFALQSEDLDEVLHEACRLVGEALATGRAKVLEIETGGESLFVRAGVGWASDVVGQVHVPMGENSSESFSIRAAEPVISRDIAREDRFDVPPFMKEAGVVALANVPIFLPGRRAYGLLQVDDTRPRDFDGNDSQFLRTYASILGPIIDRLLKLRELRESEARQRLLQASWETDALGVVTADSQSWRAYTGQTLDEWLGYGWLDAIHPDDRAYAGQQWRKAVAAHEIVDAEFRLRAPDGGWRWTNVRAAPVLDAEGQIEKWVGLNIDIDARKQAETALSKSEKRYRLLFENMTEGFALCRMIWDEKGHPVDWTYVEANRAWEQSGVPVDQTVGRTACEVNPRIEPGWIETYGDVVRTGKPAAYEAYAAGFGKWFETFAFKHSENHFGLLFRDVSDRKRAEAALRESTARQAFLLRLGDTMRARPDANAVIEAAARLLGEHLSASRVLFAEFNQAKGMADIFNGWFADGAQPFPTSLRLEDYEGPILNAFRVGETVRIEDTENPALARPDLAAIAQVGVKALLSVPLLVNGSLIVNLSIHQHRPRRWTDDEVALVQEVAERLWADLVRARAEEALGESELRFRTLSEGIPQLVWRADNPGHWTWSSPQWAAFTGQTDAESRGWGWLEPVHPDDRTAAREAWGRSRDIGRFEADYRIREVATGDFRWFQTRATPVRNERGRVVEWLGTSTDVQELREFQERQSVLVAELQHRTRNLMGVVRSVTDRTLSSSTSLADFRGRIHDRLGALSRVNGLLSRLDFGRRVSFDELLLTEFKAHGVADPEDAASQVRLEGAKGILLRSSHVQTLSLGLHELATNALKYGALSRPEGRLSVSWQLMKGDGGQRRLRVDWRESGVPVLVAEADAATEGDPAASRLGGYGRELIERALPYQLKAETTYDLTPDGLRCSITLPVSPAMDGANPPALEEPDA